MKKHFERFFNTLYDLSEHFIYWKITIFWFTMLIIFQIKRSRFCTWVLKIFEFDLSINYCNIQLTKLYQILNHGSLFHLSVTRSTPSESSLRFWDFEICFFIKIDQNWQIWKGYLPMLFIKNIQNWQIWNGYFF